MPILIYIYFILLFLNFGTGLYFYKQYSMAFKVFVWFTLYTVINELVCWNDPTPKRQLVGYLYNIYFLSSILFWTYFYHFYFKNQVVRKISKILLMISLVFIICVYFKNGIRFQQDKIALLLSIYLLILPIAYFIDIILHPSVMQLSDDAVFWISCGGVFWGVIYLFYSATMYYFAEQYPEMNQTLYTLLNIVNLINYSLVQVALMKKGARKIYL